MKLEGSEVFGAEIHSGSRLESAREKAKSADRFLKRGMDEKAKESLNDFKLELVSSQPVLNAYVSTSLEKQLLEMMSVEGFEFPDVLTELRKILISIILGELRSLGDYIRGGGQTLRRARH